MNLGEDKKTSRTKMFI